MPLLGIGAVDLIAFLVALAAVLAVGALWVLFQPLSSLMRAVPLVGGQIADAINSGLKFAMQGVILAYSAISHSVAHFLWTYGVGIWHVLYNVTHGITQALGLANQAVNAAGSVAAALPVEISGAISSANSYADGVGATVLGEAEGLYNSAISHADILYNRVEGDLFNTAAGLEATIAGDLTTAIDHADGLYNQAIATAQSLATAAALDGIHEAENVYNLVEGDLANAQDVINAHIDQILSEAETFATGAAAAAAAASIAGLLSRVGALEADATECLEPLCETVTPNAGSLGRIGQFLTNLETLGIDAFIIALAAEAVTDPQAVVTDVVAVVNDVGGPVMTGFRDLIGV